MSLEAALNENTAAVKALLAAWTSLAHASATAAADGHNATNVLAAGLPLAEVPEAKVEAPKPTGRIKPEIRQPDAPTVEAPAPVATTPASTAASPSKPVPYADVRALVLKLAATKHDAVKAINKKYGLVKLGDILADDKDFSTVTDQAKLESIYAELKAL